MLLISRFALMASSSLATQMSIGRTGASTSWSNSRPTKKVAITVGNPITSIRTDSDVKPPVRIVSRATGRKCSAADEHGGRKEEDPEQSEPGAAASEEAVPPSEQLGLEDDPGLGAHGLGA